MTSQYSLIRYALAWLAVFASVGNKVAVVANGQHRDASRYVSGFSAGLNPPIAETARTAKQVSIAAKLQDIDIRRARIENQRAAINKAVSRCVE